LAELPRNRKIVVYCAVGQRAYAAAPILVQNGFSEVYNLSGGLNTYQFVTRRQSDLKLSRLNMLGGESLCLNLRACGNKPPDRQKANTYRLRSLKICPEWINSRDPSGFS
jgi:hypothetical protein